MPLNIVVGAQWSNEGKGHITDLLDRPMLTKAVELVSAPAILQMRMCWLI